MHPYKYINMSIFLEKYVHFLFGKSLNGTVIAEREILSYYTIKIHHAHARSYKLFFDIYLQPQHCFGNAAVFLCL